MTPDQPAPLPVNPGRESLNRLAEHCRRHPDALATLAADLVVEDPAEAAGYAGVLALVAQTDPALVAPHGEALWRAVRHGQKQARWEAMQALSLIAAERPDLIASLLPELMGVIRTDQSVIARDKATEAIARFAGRNPGTAAQALPLLIEILPLANGRFASRALDGLHNAVQADPDLADAVLPIAVQHLDHHRGVARTAAQRILRQIERS